jgi:putative transposase
MGWFILAQLFSILITIVRIGRLSEQEKDLEILVLRQQLAIMQRKQEKPVKPNQAEKMMLAVLTAKLKEVTQRPAGHLRGIIRIFQPETVLGWHRELVHRKWSYARRNKGGRPHMDQELERMILRLARENPRWGYGKIEGELLKLGFDASRTTIRNMLKRHKVEPVPVRSGSIGWRQLMAHYKEQILACDFFTVETIRLKTLYVLFFIELSSRRIYLAGATANPNEIWVTQQARQLIWELNDREPPLRFLIHDHDRKFTDAFDTLFRSEGLRIIPIPYQAPNANSYAERWVRTAREECLDHILILNETHLRRVLGEFINENYNVARPHRGIEQQTPIPYGQPKNRGTVQCRKVLGGILNDYYRKPASPSICLS